MSKPKTVCLSLLIAGITLMVTGSAVAYCQPDQPASIDCKYQALQIAAAEATELRTFPSKPSDGYQKQFIAWLSADEGLQGDIAASYWALNGSAPLGMPPRRAEFLAAARDRMRIFDRDVDRLRRAGKITIRDEWSLLRLSGSVRRSLRPLM